jgi:hypothetical protein
VKESPVERALDVVVYGPLGVALFARDTVPGIMRMFAARGRSAVDQQVRQARTVGQLAVRFGGPQVRRRVEEGVAAARAQAESTVASLAIGRAGADAAPARPGPVERRGRTPRPAGRGPASNGRATPARPEPGPDVPAASALAIPDYDELSASQVVERLEGLDAGDLDAVRAYEAAHRNRRTILGKIAQLGA